MGLQVEAVDTVTIKAMFPTDAEEIADAIERLRDEPGFKLVDAAVIDDGQQRDPLTKGVRLVFKRVP